ncbi:hypothetical protein PG996_002522 [Apiospora saccharicola]|uniref:RRM domain-containing protein n=1 Tax=Apiospora saccharicola TaxID=335842 RepID=A0ABR1WJP6_9PEZI
MASSSSRSPSDQDTCGQQNPREDLVVNPNIWRDQVSTPGRDDASVASSFGQHRGGHQGSNMGYHVQAQTNNTLPARPTMSNMLPARPEYPGPANTAGQRPSRGFTSQPFGTPAVAAPGPLPVFGSPYPDLGNVTGQLPLPGFGGQYPGHANVAGQRPPPGLTGQNQFGTANNGWQSHPGRSHATGQQAAHPGTGGGYGRGRQSLGFTTQQPGHHEMVQSPAGSAAAAFPRGAANPSAAYPPIRAQDPAYDPNFEFSKNYKGSRSSNQNRSHNIDDGINCSVFIRGLPPNCTPDMILAHIRGCGAKIWALSINAPDDRNPNHCAAKLVFFQRCGVDWLFNHIRNGRFVITDEYGTSYTPNAVINKVKNGPQALNDIRSRVLIVSGPSDLISVTSLDAFFKYDFYFEADCAFTTYDQDGWRVIEFHFGSTRCQSENGYQALQRLRTQGPGTFAP